jgi:hypothetical protein
VAADVRDVGIPEVDRRPKRDLGCAVEDLVAEGSGPPPSQMEGLKHVDRGVFSMVIVFSLGGWNREGLAY